MKKAIIILFTIFSAFSFNSCNKEDLTGKKLRIICEDFRPYSYLENNQVKGISADIVRGIMDNMGLEKMDIEVTTDWEAAFDLLKTTDNVALFTTDLTANRKDIFQWVGPISMSTTSFVGLKSSGFKITSINEAKDLPSVGVVTGYSTTELLQAKNFQNLVMYNTLNEAVAALYAGTVSSVFDLTQPILMTAANDGKDTDLLTDLFVYSTIQGYIAFSEGVSPKLAEAWQKELDQLKTEGFVQDIYDKYLPGTPAPGLLTIYTEENPPQNYREPDGSLTGSSAEIVNAMMEITLMNETITTSTWKDAMDQILLTPNSMIFSTTRTTDRESLLKWIGPVCKKNYCFYVMSNRTIEIKTIDDAKLLSSIGVPEGWASEDELIGLGFTNIQTWSTPQKVFQKLLTGKVDAVVLNDISIPYMTNLAGISVSDVRNELQLSSGETYLAFSLDTKPEYLQKWQDAYTTIINNGKFAEIWHKWYPDVDWLPLPR